ncbi:hypothetical protein AGMMS49992_18790 [Clostridia bacterium]|nr:hypothetical protein AGMMS49992_18790 [Clostridia bacterium]
MRAGTTTSTEAVQQQRPIQRKPNTGSEIDLVELFYYMLEKIWYIAGAALLAAVVAYLYTSYYITPLYQSTATLYVFKSKDSAVGVDVSGLSVASQLTNDYIQLFKLYPVNEEVKVGLDLPYSAGQIAGMTTVSNPANTRYLNITVKSHDPDEAMKMANALGKAAQKMIKEKFKTDEPTELAPARLNRSIVYPNKMRNVMNGALLGGMVVVGLFFLIFIMDDKIKSSEEMMKYFGVANLAVIPMVGITKKK